MDWEERAFEKVGNLSHGEHRQLEIAMALATQPHLLLLDEPMAGMGTEEGRKILKILQKNRVELIPLKRIVQAGSILI